MGSIPGLGRSHVPWGTTTPEPVSHSYGAHVLRRPEPVHPEPVLCNKRSHRNAMKSSHCLSQIEKACAQQ